MAGSISIRELRDLAAAMGCHNQTEFGRRLGITQSRVSQILSGSYPIKRGPLMNLVRTLQAQYARQSEDVDVAATSPLAPAGSLARREQ
ncbi:MAG TPA: helix-turn-helix transcriptional regulator [Gemmatimonadaceae bacterium]|nr:helix-turn-helix transcriptional regulator [Gemmatimonadaceae bacterium]